MMIKSIIIEDEEPARVLIRKYLEKFQEIEVLGEYNNGFDGLKAINTLKPDLIFLDIQLPKITGMEILEVMEYTPHIIFTTAFDEYAIKAFEMNAVDYLLKPFSSERFQTAIEKAKKRINDNESKNIDYTNLKNHISYEQAYINRIIVKSGKKVHILAVKDVNYIEAQDDYVMIYTSDNRYLKNNTMKYYEEHVDPSIFVRIHRSYILNINYLESLELYSKDNYIVKLKNNITLNVSKSGYKKLKEVLSRA